MKKILLKSLVLFSLWAGLIWLAMCGSPAYAEPASTDPSCEAWAVATFMGPSPTAARAFYHCAIPEMQLVMGSLVEFEAQQSSFVSGISYEKIGAASDGRGGHYSFYTVVLPSTRVIWYVININAAGKVVTID